MKTKHWVLLFAAIAAACLITIVLLPLPQGVAHSAELHQNGTLIRTVSLDKDARFTIPSPNGGSNLVVVDRGRIRVEQADCPDKLCVKRGEISRSGETITCLPHKLTVTVHSVDGEVELTVD